jgi:serine O-acetyltransferase
VNLRITGAELGPFSVIGPGLLARHPLGLVIGAGTRIGADCTLHPHVVFGQRRPGSPGQGFPAIGNECSIGAGAVLLGAITLGDRVTVAAGAVVLDDVPDGSLVAGVPARVVSRRTG